MQHYDSFSAEETYDIGRALAEKAVPGEIYALSGDLGVGKTVFTKGFAAGLGITEPVNSPTFTILQVYEGGRLPLYHFDVYRIEEPEEMEEVGLDDYLFGNGRSRLRNVCRKRQRSYGFGRTSQEDWTIAALTWTKARKS